MEEIDLSENEEAAADAVWDEREGQETPPGRRTYPGPREEEVK